VILLLFFSVLTLSAFSFAIAQTNIGLTLNTPSKDATICNGGSMDVNDGADYRLDFGFDNYSDITYRFLVQFDLPPTLSADSITSATLKLAGPLPWSSGFPSGEALRACRVTHDWVEGTGKSGFPAQDGVTWNEYSYGDGLTTAANNWGTPGGDYTLEYSSTVIIPPYPVTWSYLNMTVTSIVKGWVSNAYPNFGFLIKLDKESDAYKGGVFDSIEYGEKYGEASTLKLEINYTAPTTIPTPSPTPVPTPSYTPSPAPTESPTPTSTPRPTAAPTPTATSTATPSPASTPTPAPTPNPQTTFSTPTEYYAIIAVAVIAVIVIIFFTLKKRTPNSPKVPPPLSAYTQTAK
jgi:cell division septation protein DedD